MNENMQYTDEWFYEARHNRFKLEDLKAIKERFEHLPKMMDELNERLKNGDKDADYLALCIQRYTQRLVNALESDYQYMSWGRANEMITY